MRSRLRLAAIVASLSAAALLAWVNTSVVRAKAQQAPAATLQSGVPDRVDWLQHNLDLNNSRFSALSDINTGNVGRLTLKWSADVDGELLLSQVTPTAINGVLYVNAGSKLFAFDAVTGQPRWTHSVEPAFTGNTMGRRGPMSSPDGKVIYAYGGTGSQTVLYAVDAQTGRTVETFGNKGRLSIADAAVRFKYPDKDPTGYELASVPAIYGDTMYLGLAQSEKRIAGGLLVALDVKTGAVKWVFNTVPQGPGDDGWEIAKDTWKGGPRLGGGVWTTPAIDPELGLLYFNAANPYPDYTGDQRKGINLFTNAVIALHINTGKLAWYFQTLHHDIWDFDLVTGPTLFNTTIGNRAVKGLATGQKACLLYLLDRETGQPIHPIVETPVPTQTDVPGEEVWPTQPFPYTANGVPMRPYCATYPTISDPVLAKRARVLYQPYSMKEAYIVAHGGSSFGPPSFSPRTGLLYVTAKNAALSYLVQPVGQDALVPGGRGGSNNIAKRDGETGMPKTQTVSAYNVATGEVAWQATHDSVAGVFTSGNFVTAGDLVFQGADTGMFYGFDARNGAQLFAYKSPDSIRASPMTYRVGGHQYVSVVAMNKILTFGLP